MPSKIPDGETRGWIVPIGGAENKENDRQILERFVRVSGGTEANIVVIPTASRMHETGRRYEHLFKEIGATGRFYFLHSYYFAPKDQKMILGVTDYGGPFASCVRAGNIYGVQFHPEKSHQWGIQLLKNFAVM